MIFKCHEMKCHEILLKCYEKRKFHYSKYPISINQCRYCTRFLLVKKILSTLLVTKMMKKLSHYL